MLVVFRGLPGTGKTFLARKVVQRMPDFLVLSRDSLRAGILPTPTFSPEEKNLVDELILSMAGFLLGRGRNVLIDGMALSSARRVEDFAHAAASRGIPWRLITCVCSEQTALARLHGDRGAHPAGDRGEKLYFEVKARFERVAHASLVIDTDADTAENLSAVLRYLNEPSVL